MKIAVLYICIGEYDKLWSHFYASCEKYFCVSIEKYYFVFTDSRYIEANSTIFCIPQDNLGWPFNTLYRYRMFLRIKEQLLDFDYVVFFNANCEFTAPISIEEFFGVNKKLVACLHPGFFDKNIEVFTYEKREKSEAYICHGRHYFAGGICGGRADTFLHMCYEVLEKITKDLNKGILGIWHDESYWNAYLNNQYDEIVSYLHILTPAYLYPEGWKIPFKPKIILRDKAKVINVCNIKNISSKYTFKNILKKIKKTCSL